MLKKHFNFTNLAFFIKVESIYDLRLTSDKQTKKQTKKKTKTKTKTKQNKTKQTNKQTNKKTILI